jgi:peptidoglycan/LPS O-acetylase OafA/YrhL
MRGAAALSVVVFHALFSIEGGEALIKPLDYASFDPWAALLLPLRPFWMGHEAVILFFVLSGLVLTLPFFRQGVSSYPGYVLKRLCRLFLPAIAAVLLSIAMLAAVGTRPAPWPMPMLDLLWREQPSIDLVLRHLLLLSDGKPDEFYVLDLPLWTLEVEWRVSLLLPFLALLARRSDLAVLMAAASGMLLPPLEQRLLGTEMLSSLRYLPVFTFGLLLAKHLDATLRRLRALPPSARLGLWLLSILLIYARVLLPAPAVQAHHRLLIGIGAALLIALVLASGNAQRALGRRPLQWLGRVSFSLYLLHMPMMLAAARLLPDGVTPIWRLAVGIGLSLVLAEIFHRLVEKPSMQAGRALSAWAEARQPARAYSSGD